MPARTLHSLFDVRELVLDYLDAADARSIVEVGADTGAFTDVLATWSSARGGAFSCIEPLPGDALRAVLASHPAAKLVAARSPGALAHVAPPDAWIIDGDHNYHVVRTELASIDAIARASGRPPVVILHDVAWPCARRDFYYDAAALPEGAVHPHARGVPLAPGDPGVAPHGLRVDPTLDVAIREGGPGNGVLTAVEDFCHATAGWSFARVPVVFGLGVLWPDSASWASSVAARVRPWHEHPVLARIEQNRIEMIGRLDVAEHEGAEASQRIEAAHRRAAAEAARADTEATRAARAEARVAFVEGTFAWRLVVWARSVRDRMAPEGTLQRHALDVGAAMARSFATGHER